MKRTLHKALSMLLTAAMVLNMGLTPVFAEGANPPGTSGVCTHHTKHTEGCGYQAGTPCNHEHTEECYTKELTCTLVEGEAPEIATDSDAVLDSGTAPADEAHSHSEGCYTQTENCPHEHDDTCGYAPDSPCTFDPASCEQCNPGDKPAEKVCTCEPALGADETGHGEDCPLYTAPEFSEAVTALIAMVDALPNAADITEENKEATKPAYEAAAMAYEALSDADKAAFEATEQYTKLMALRDVLFGAALTPAELDLLRRGEQNQADLSLDEQLAYLQLVARLREESGITLMGLGDTDMPFQIATAVQLADLAAKVNEGNANFNAKSYILVNDIDLSAYQSGAGWTPIGNLDNPFNGTFDGGGNVITGLVIDNPDVDFQGLFGVIDTGGRVKNLGVVDCDITGLRYVGGVAGVSIGRIENCYATGSVSGNNNVGGVAGDNWGTIENCYSTGSISGSDIVGGVAGGNGGRIENCYSTGSISGGVAGTNVGGVVGRNNGGTIESCYATGSASGYYYVGGVAGWSNGLIQNCAALNPGVSGSSVGRVVGYNKLDAGGTLINNYAWSGMTGGGSNNTADGTDGADLTCTDGTLGKQFTEIFGGNPAWIFADNKLPILAGAGGSQSSALPLWMTTTADATTIFIYTAEQLAQLATEVNGGDDKAGKTYILANSISLSAYQSGTGWTPIGNPRNMFKGSFDGNGKVITGLVIDNPDVDSQGLFGVIDTGGRVKNLGVVDCDITGRHSVGGVAGDNWGTIENCYSTGSISGSDSVGGVVGVSIGRIENCYSTGSVSGNDVVGGVVGNNGGTIESCYATGSISGNGFVGGVAGWSNGLIQNCAALNPGVSGSSVGRVAGNNSNTLTNNYAWSGMTGGGSNNTADGTDGADLTCTGGTLGKQFTEIFGGNPAWIFADNKLPILAGAGGSQSSALPLWMTTTADANTIFIYTAEQLAQLATEVNDGDVKTGKTYILENNISLSAYQSGTDWTPIGNLDNPFKGSFDGGGKVITGLVIDNPDVNSQGLFGAIGSDSTVKNLGVVDCDITGRLSVGGVAGDNWGTIENCYSTGSISGSDSVGGVAGMNSGRIENCYTTGSVSGGYTYVGGVAGDNWGTIENCYSTGSVSGNDVVGGVAGYNYDTIKNCAALNPDISGANVVGRVVGWNDSSSTFKNNYAWSGMSVKQGGADKPLDKGEAKVDGEDVFAVGGVLLKSNNTAFSWETDLGFDGTVWDIPTGGYKLPKLRGSSASYPAMPSGGLVEQVTINQGKTAFMYAPDGVDIAAAFHVLATDAVKVKYTTSTPGAVISGSKLSLAPAPTGDTTVSVTATVDAGAFNSGASLTVSITVKRYATTTTLAADKAAITYGDSVALTATVAKANSGDPGEPSGSVQFKRGDTNLGASVAVVGGKAEYTSTDLPVGSHNITAVFISDSSSLFGGSTSSDVAVAVSGNGGGDGGGNGGNGGSSSDGTSTSPPTNADAKVPTKVDENGNATVTIKEQDIADAIKKAQNAANKSGIAVNIKLESSKAINSFAVTLPKAVQKQLVEAKVRAVIISSGNLSITFDVAALNHIYTTANADVTVTATKIVSTSLSKEAQAATGGRPVYDFKVTGGGKNITAFGTGKISLSIPYPLKKVDGNGKPSATGSFENPGNLVGAYIDASGKLTYLPGSSYNVANKAMLINTNHLSLYGVACKQNAPTFTDTATHWAKDDIDFVAARGLLTGTTATTFSPNTSMTRGMFVTALGRLAGIDPNSYKTGSFTDVPTTAYYAPYANWAASKGITNGTTATTFSPDQNVTRQEMAQFMANYAEAMGYIMPKTRAAIIFADNSSITSDAVKTMQMAGVIMGKDGNRFDPTGTATRAEGSAMLRRFVELVANSETAEGWAQNDSGNWMYFEKGKAVTGKKNIGGTTYEFDQYGVTAILPKDRRYAV